VYEALGAAHALGILHRDLKPGNVFLPRRPGAPERAVLLDFGLAKLSDAETSTAQLTATGAVLGTRGHQRGAHGPHPVTISAMPFSRGVPMARRHWRAGDIV
jgi:serine/threonine protein kinase